MLDAMSDVLKTMYYDLTRMIWRPIEDPKWFRDNKVRPIKGVLLHGLPGTGKSQLARAVRQECNRQMENKVSFYGLTGAKLMNGDPVANLEELFRAERLQLLKIFCQNFDVSRVKMDKVAKDTEGFSPSDLAALVYEASDLASTDSNKTLVGPVSRWIHNNDTHTKIAGKHFFLAFSKITPSNQL